MKGDKKTIQYLNQQLKSELSAINQYFLHARMLKHWGFEKLAEHEYQESIEEMKHADALVQRILTIGGLPNLQDLHKLLVGESVAEVLHCDLQLEASALETLKEGMAHCEDVRDFASRDLLQTLLNDTEEHVDWLETQIQLVEQLGEQNYLQLQV